jgi:hypothetical protein
MRAKFSTKNLQGKERREKERERQREYSAIKRKKKGWFAGKRL